MFVKTHGRFDQFRRDICNFGQIPEKTRNGMPPPFSAFCKNETFDRLFCRLLGGETGPIIIAVFSRVIGVLQVSFRLLEPVNRSVNHGMTFVRIGVMN